MDESLELIKKYFDQTLSNNEKTPFCLSNEALINYFQHKSDKNDSQKAEKHIAGCGFCLYQLNLIFEAGGVNKSSNIQVPDDLIKNTKNLIKDNKTPKKSKMKKSLFLAGALISFILSFFIPRYFIQCLVVTLIFGIGWVFESESGRMLIMVLDSWRRHSHDDDEEISQRLKDRFKSYHK